MEITGIRGGRVLTATGIAEADIVLSAGAIDFVSPAEGDHEPAVGDSGVIDATGLTVAPGFIDLQVNGGFGLDLANDPELMWDLGRQLPRSGVTGFLPTIVSSPVSTTDAAIAAFGHRPPDYLGSEPLGLHFEGPMINPLRRGAHSAQSIVDASPDVVGEWSRANGVAMVTIAPELPNAAAIIAELVRRGVVVAAGHSDATAIEALAGLEAGVTMVTHIFNAMAPMHHREPNLAGLALAERDLAAGLIVDGVHVDPTVVKAAWNAKGPRGIALVTDAVAAMGEPPGTHRFSGRPATSDGASVLNEEGTLAGSLLSMDQALRNLISFTGCSLKDALESASTTPAGVLGDRRRGSIESAAAADLVLVRHSPAHEADIFEVQITLCAGRVAYVSESALHRLPSI